MRKGFTMVEVLVAISLFTIAAVVSTNLLVDVMNLEKKSAIQNELFEDANILMQQLTKEIQNGTIDYEEYYSINAIQAVKKAGAKDTIYKDTIYYGINYGVYASRFYDPGRQLSGVATLNPDDLGVECSFPWPLGNKKCEILYNLSSDFDTGENPYKKGNRDENLANAFCDRNLAGCGATSHIRDELYLIDATGTKKTILGKKVMNANDYAVGIVRMEGVDFDQNGVIDIFSCSEEFKCLDIGSYNTAITVYPFLERISAHLSIDEKTEFIRKFEAMRVRVPKKEDLGDDFVIANSHFVPITPLKSSVKDLKFIINPIEDPYKAYGEPAMQVHPSVTIILTMELSAATKNDYPGKFGEITVQSTVAAGVIGKIDSYPPVNDVIKGPADKSWIQTVLLGLGVNT